MMTAPTSGDIRRLSPSAAKLLAEMAEAERAVGSERRAALLEMLLDWHRPFETAPSRDDQTKVIDGAIAAALRAPRSAPHRG